MKTHFLFLVLTGSLLLFALAACDAKTRNVDSCGDGFIDPGEECDLAELQGASCASLQYHRLEGQLRCGEDCRYDVSDCGGTRCGDGVLQSTFGEQCDGPDLGSQTCVGLGYQGGALACSSSCHLDVSGCENACGDGVIQAATEDCDGNDLNQATCQSLGFYTGTLACGADCSFDLTPCAGRCGDGVLDSLHQEQCDGTNLDARTCESLGYHPGTLACSADCRFNLTGCPGRCGDGVIQAGFETCEGSDLDGETCESQGHSHGGTLACGDDCRFDFSACNGRCGDGVAQPAFGEACDGTDLQGRGTCGEFDYFNAALVPTVLACDAACEFVLDGCTDFYQWGSSNHDHPLTLSRDAAGNFYIQGYTFGSVSGTPNAGGQDAFVAKRAPDGSHLWASQWGTAGNDTPARAVTDAAGNTTVFGHTGASMDGQPHLGAEDFFLTRLGPDGAKLWTVMWGTAGSEQGFGLCAGAPGVVFAAGSTNQALAAPLQGDFDAYLAKLGGNGAILWNRQWGTVQHDFGWDGTKSWTRLWGGAVDDQGRDLAVGSDGRIHVLGKTSGVLAPGGGGGWDVVLFRFTE